VGIPIALEVCDEGWAESAIGLVARIGRAIAAEQIERLRADAQGAAIADRADRARVAEALDHVRKRSVHLIGPSNLVTDQPALGAVAGKLAFILNRLARDPIAGETS